MGTGLYSRASRIKRLSFGLLLIILLLIGLKLWRIARPTMALYDRYRFLQETATDPTNIDVRQLPDMLHQTRSDLETVQYEVTPLYGLLHRLDWVPMVGGDLAAVPALLDMGVALTQAGDTIVEAIDPALTTAFDLQFSKETFIPVAVETIAQAQPNFEQAQTLVTAAHTKRTQVDISSLSPPLARQVERLDQLWPIMDLALDLIPLAPVLLGIDTPQNYLVIAQNNDELRATGGFISSAGMLTIDQGQIANLSFEDSYAIDDFSQYYPAPPTQLLEYMLAEIWIFRDANWSPDYPTSVQSMLDLYRVSRPTQFQGVITADQIALQKIVEALEPLQVPGWDTPATGENVIQLIRQSWSPDEHSAQAQSETVVDGQWFANRKNFISDLTKAVRDRIEQTPSTVPWPRLAAAVLSILDERHVQIWLQNEAAQSLIASRGWDGAIRQTDQDFLMVVDTNMGFNKVNAITETRIDYEVTLTENGGEAILRLTHENDSHGEDICSQVARYGGDYSQIVNRCFWNYLRVYTPADTELLESTPHETPAEFLWRDQAEPAQVEPLTAEAGKSVWGTFFVVPHHSQLETVFRYQLPARVVKLQAGQQRYQLLIQKQAGTQANELQVAIQLPEDHHLIEAKPTPNELSAEGRIVFDLTLQRDQEIEIVFE